jgi:hypothetical protein
MKKALTKNKKIGIVVGVIALLGLIGFGTYKIAKNNTDKKKEEEKKKLEEQSKKDETNTSSQETNVGSGLPASTDISKSCDPSTSPLGCGNVITTHDSNYNYVWCKNQWWTISKSSPASGGRVIICWTSLGGNATATDKLNAKYPNKS